MSNRTSHTERTASQPRQNALHKVRIAQIKPVNPRIRLLKLVLPYAINFLPGQWLDVHIPSLPKAGGFTITSTPSQASDNHDPHLELAIQHSPANPPAAWLWREPHDILKNELRVRVGGSFVWPPPKTDTSSIKRLVLVAGGVGINPLISILSHLHETRTLPPIVRLLYATKIFPGETLDDVLFYTRLRQIFQDTVTHTSRPDTPGMEPSHNGSQMQIFTTTPTKHSEKGVYLDLSDDSVGAGTKSELHSHARSDGQGISSLPRRFESQDLEETLGPEQERKNAVVYVCGPAGMTDEVVERIKGMKGVDGEKVLCEKWW